MDILVTGGTVFVSRFAARYFANRGHRVTVLNRGTRPQEAGVEFIRADRRALTHELSGRSFSFSTWKTCAGLWRSFWKVPLGGAFGMWGTPVR